MSVSNETLIWQKRLKKIAPKRFFVVVVATKSGRKLTRKVAILVMLQ